MTERQRAVAYYGTAALALGFGVLGIASIGFPFLFAGVVLFAVGPVRRRRDVLWPPLLAVLVATMGYVALASTRCASTPGGGQRCENFLGFELPGDNFTAFRQVTGERTGGGIDLDSLNAYLGSDLAPIAPPGTDRVNELP